MDSELLMGHTADWYAPLLPRVEGACLDCVSDDLALLLASHGVGDVCTPFAQDWRFDLIERADGPVRVDLPPADQDELLGQRTGWRPDWHPATSTESDFECWQRALASGEPVLLVGDAFLLPWLPYAGHEHMDHGFVLTGIGTGESGGLIAHLVDPYDNITEWGRATPLTARIRLEVLTAALGRGRWAVLVPAEAGKPLPPQAAIVANATAILTAAAHGSYQRFVSDHPPGELGSAQSLALQTWLLARNRALHARWLSGLAPGVLDRSLADRFGAAIASGWQRAAEMSYIALRRVRAGRKAPAAAVTAIEAMAAEEIAMARSLLCAQTVRREQRRKAADVAQ